MAIGFNGLFATLALQLCCKREEDKDLRACWMTDYVNRVDCAKADLSSNPTFKRRSRGVCIFGGG